MNKDKVNENLSVSTKNDLLSGLIRAFILPLGGVVMTLVVLYCNNETKDDTKIWIFVFGIIFALLFLAGIALYIIIAVEKYKYENTLMDLDKIANSSHQQSSDFLNKMLKSIKKKLKDMWFSKKPYKNLEYKALDKSIEWVDVYNNESKRKKIRRIKKNNIEKRIQDNTKIKNYEVVTNHICNTLFDLQRILLEMSEHKIREEIGNILINYSDDIDHLAAAHIDFIGWTYMLNGTKKYYESGKKYIKKGINLLTYYYKQCQDDNKKKEILLKLARAHRHLGTTRYVIKKEYSSSKSKEIKEHLVKSDLYICMYCGLIHADIDSIEDDKNGYENAKKYIKKIDKKYSDDKCVYVNIYNKIINEKTNDENLCRLAAGVVYNKCLCRYLDLINSKERNSDLTNELYNIIEVLNNPIFNKLEIDDHRRIKVKSLISEICFRIMRINKILALKDENHSFNKYENLLETSTKCIKDIEKILKNNIYFDEGMELYIEQKFERLCYEIEK